MKQRLFSRLFIILPAILFLSIVNVGNALAADPVIIRYEVTAHQTTLAFVTYQNENGQLTELLSEGTTLWSHQFSTTNPEQLVSLYPAPVDAPNGDAWIVAKIFVNNELYRTVTGQNAAATTFNDTLDNLLATGPVHQWAIRYEVTAQQTTLGFLTYSNNQTANQNEFPAAGTTVWNYHYIAANADQPIKVEAVPIVPNNDPNKYYAIVIKIFVNNELHYSATFGPDTQPAIDEKLSDLLANNPQQPEQQPQAQNSDLSMQVIPGITPDPVTQASVSANAVLPTYVSNPQLPSEDSAQPYTAGFSFFAGNNYFFVTIGSSPQPPNIEQPSNIMLAAVPAQY